MGLNDAELKLVRYALVNATRAINELNYYMMDVTDQAFPYDTSMTLSAKSQALYELRAKVEVFIELQKSASSN
jgi:hypothetical protein